MTTSDAAAQASIGAAARELHLPTVRAEATRLAEIAVRERQTHLVFLAEVLAAEVDERSERRRARRIAEAHFPRLKRLAEFNIDAVPTIHAAQLAALARAVVRRPGFSLVGLMAYEGHVAGVGDEVAGKPVFSRAIRVMHAAARKELAQRRWEAVRAVRAVQRAGVQRLLAG